MISRLYRLTYLVWYFIIFQEKRSKISQAFLNTIPLQRINSHLESPVFFFIFLYIYDIYDFHKKNINVL